MATKLDLLKDFAGGQGGGIGSYSNYPPDHDSNYLDIETSVNQLVDEVANARLADSAIPGDMLTSDGFSEGRYSAEDAAVSRPTSTTVTITSGPIYVNGQKVIVVGQTLDFTGLANDPTMFINVDVNGLLNIATAGGQAFFDLVNVNWDGSLVDADVIDNIFNGGEVFNNIKHGYIQETGDSPPTINDPFNVDHPGRLDPPLRFKTRAGVLGASGMFMDAERIFWTSDLDGSSDTVLAQIWSADGQQLALEQARVMLVRSSTQSITNAGNIPVEWDTLPASNTGGTAERFEPESYNASTDWQSGTGNRDIVIPTGGGFNGTYNFTCTIVIDTGTATFFDVRIIQTVGGTQVVSRVRVPSAPTNTSIMMPGLFDFINADEWQVQITHDSAAAVNLTFARFTAQLVGGGV